jgi:hypothetical protein
MIIYWNTNKISLSPQEVDSNFQYLETELQETKTQLDALRKQVAYLEADASPVKAVLALSYQHPTLSLSIGENTTTVCLPIWRFRGVWCKTFCYDPGDLVVHEARIYQCKITNQVCPPEASWEELPFHSACSATISSSLQSV